MKKDQYYAQLDGIKLALDCSAEVMHISSTSRAVADDTLAQANRLSLVSLGRLSRILEETDFEELEDED